MRCLALCTAAVGALLGMGCDSLLGIEDPTPDFGGDGGPRTLRSISIGPDPLSLPLGVSQQLTATGVFDDGTQEDITAETQFLVEEGSSITVTPAGFAHAIAQGPSMVTARLGRIAGGALAQVGPAAPTSLMFTLESYRLARGQAARVHVLAMLTDGTMGDVTSTVSFTSDNEAVATAAGGQVSGLAAGTATITARAGTATTSTIQVTVTTKPCRPVINEFQTHGAMGGADEWVEILNPCTSAVELAGWRLVYRADSNTNPNAPDTNTLVMLTGALAPGELRLYAGETYPGTADQRWMAMTGFMQQNNGGIAIRDEGGNRVDSVAYGAVLGGHPFIEGAATPAMASGRTAPRMPFDGRDDDNGPNDFMQSTTGTPRTLNAP